MSFSTILVANRGEIAARIFRTAQALGYETVAVFSEADRHAPFARMADRAVAIGGAAPSASYLRADAILEAAAKAGADAIHPGYGFLAEDAAFAAACSERGITFIGPPPAAIAAMGNKAEAKAAMRKADVPCVPGYGEDDEGTDDDALVAAASDVGFPLLVKAVSGGGGRGMRLVHEPRHLKDAIVSARREAKSAFGDDGLILERFIEEGRHIEIQVFADQHGHAIHLGERDCTTQRRRQKVIEEAPSPVVDAAMRARMGRDAVAAALAIGYVGAGTVEFIVGADGAYFFLEMNTRLQVEHPVTELITGLDLVDLQLRVAAGEPLPLTQDDVTLSGHAIEVRLYAEDPLQGFAPQTGSVRYFRPAGGEGVRFDCGVEEGGKVTPHYDPMSAKVIAHGKSRSEAIRRLRRALRGSPLFGVVTNGSFLHALLGHEAFVGHSLHTATLDHWSATAIEVLAPAVIPETVWALAAALLAQPMTQPFVPSASARAPLRATTAQSFDLSLEADDGQTRTYRWDAEARTATYDGTGHRFDALEADGSHTVRFTMDGVWRRATYLREEDGHVWLALDGEVHHFFEPSALPDRAATDPRHVTAPVAGTVAALDVKEGDAVTAGQRLGVIEAMKMETQLLASADGTVAAVKTELGAQVEAGVLLVELTIEDADG